MSEQSNPTVTEFKGHKVLNLPLDEAGRYTFSFGISKAQALLVHRDAVEAFVADPTQASYGECETDAYKGHTLLVLPLNGGRYSFSFGLRKASVVVENWDAIDAFVEQFGEPAAVAA